MLSWETRPSRSWEVVHLSHSKRALALCLLMIFAAFAPFAGALGLPVAPEVPEPVCAALAGEDRPDVCGPVNDTLASVADPEAALCAADPAVCDARDAVVALVMGLDPMELLTLPDALADLLRDGVCGDSGVCRGAFDAASEYNNIDPDHAPGDLEHAVGDHLVGGACSDQPEGDGTCATVNETRDEDPTNVPGAAMEAACAPRPGTCAGAQEAAAEVDNVDAEHAPDDVQHAARDHLLAGACSDQPEDDTTCASVNETLETDPDAVVGGLRAVACAARPGTCAGIDDAADDRIDPANGTADLERAIFEHFFSGFCSDGGEPCVVANDSRTTADYISAGNGALVVVEPGAIHTRSPVAISFATVLPASEKTGPAFLVQYAVAGESTWTDIANVACPGNAARICELEWEEPEEGSYVVRVAYHAAQTCDVQQCAVSAPFVVDDTIPMTRVEGLASTQAEREFAVSYALADADELTETTLEYSLDDGPFVAWPATSDDGSFEFVAAEPGLYKFRTLGVDRAGNAEAAKNAWEAATRVEGTFPEGRLVVLDIDSPLFVGVGDDFRYAATAYHGDDATLAPYARVEALLDGVVVAERFAGANGGVEFTFSRQSVGVADYVFRVTHEGEVPEPVSSYDLMSSAVWTALVPAVEALERDSLFENVGSPFEVTYCVRFAHDLEPVALALLDVQETTSGYYNAGATDETGCMVMELTEEVIGSYTYQAYASLLTEDGVFLQTMAPAPQDLTFTRVDLSIGVSNDFIPIDGTTTFTVCGFYAHGAKPPAGGATVEVLDKLGATLETATLGPDGCVDVDHVFAAVYDGIVTARLVLTPEGVTLEQAPTPVGRMVATEARIGTITVDDAFVDVGSLVAYTVPLTWEHDGTNLTSGVLTISPPDQAASTCAIAAGTATCLVSRGMPQTGSFPITLESQGVTRIQGAPAVTPDVVWTRVVATGSVVDAYLPLGAAAEVTYDAVYAHDGSAVPSFDVRITSGCDDDKTVAGAAGVAMTTLAHEEFCDTSIVAQLVEAAEGITLQDPSQLTVTERIVWTRVAFTLATTDAFVGIGEPLNLTGTAVYEGTPDLVTGTVEIRDGDDNKLGEADIVAGAFATSVTKTIGYSGVVDLDLASDGEGIGIHLPKSLQATWTDIVLSASVDDDFVPIAETVAVTGTATYLVSGDLVPSGTLDVLDDEGNVLAGAMITEGAWSANVSKDVAYSAPLTVRLTSSFNNVAAADLDMGVVTWTRILLSRNSAADTFVNVGDGIAYSLTADYAHGGPVAEATIEARSDNGTVLGTCEVVAGACALTVASEHATEQDLDITVASAYSDVTTMESPLSTELLTWTRLVLTKSVGSVVTSAGSGANVQVTASYEHNGARVPNALVTLSGFSDGDQVAFTNATGVATIPAIEDAIGVRDVAVSARVASESIGAHRVLGGAAMTLRWTAIGFRAFTYDVAPLRYENGSPVFAVGTTVKVCTTTEAADTGDLVTTAQVLLRGASRPTNATGDVCITIVKSSSERDVRVTAHGLNGNVEGAIITATVDRAVTLLFRESA